MTEKPKLSKYQCLYTMSTRKKNKQDKIQIYIIQANK